MTKQTEALKLALEGLEKWHFDKDPRGADQYITAIREALAEQPAQQQEPVAWIYEFYADRGHLGLAFEPQRSADNTPLYGAPQPLREWVDLTDEELETINDCGDTDSYKFARAIEAKLREKNT